MFLYEFKIAAVAKYERLIDNLFFHSWQSARFQVNTLTSRRQMA